MPATQVDITVPEQILSDWAKQCPDFFRREFLDCAVVSFALRVATWLDSSEIFFVSSATEVMSACVAVVRFASARVWSC